MVVEQLQLFERTELDILNEKIQGCIKTTDNLRRGIFTRHDALFQMYNDLKNGGADALNALREVRSELSIIRDEMQNIRNDINLLKENQCESAQEPIFPEISNAKKSKCLTFCF